MNRRTTSSKTVSVKNVNWKAVLNVNPCRLAWFVITTTTTVLTKKHMNAREKGQVYFPLKLFSLPSPSQQL